MVSLKLSSKVIFLFLSIVNGVKLKCEYKSESGFNGLDGQNVYYCTVINKEIFTDERVNIDSVEGQHTGQKTKADVTGIRFDSIPFLKFFPQNLQNVFGELLIIQIFVTDLKEIHQDDIKVFPKLRQLYLAQNKITSIDADLFKFNSELRYINLNNNQISHIDPTAFDHLNNLVYLRLSDNKCKNALSNADNSRSAVLQIIQRIKSLDCISVNVLQKKKEIEDQTIKNITLLQASNEEYAMKYDSCQSNLTSVANEKSTLSKQFNELQDKARESEKINQQLREEIEQIRSTVQELKSKNEDLTKNLADREEKCESAQRNLDENEELNSMKIIESQDKCEIKVLQSKLELNDKVNEWKDKYLNLLHSKYLESENIIVLVN